jgi:hypothetical protein
MNDLDRMIDPARRLEGTDAPPRPKTLEALVRLALKKASR